MIDKHIKFLTQQAISNNYINSEDEFYSINKILNLLDEYEYDQNTKLEAKMDPYDSIQALVEFAVEKNICKNNTTDKDIFEAKLTDCFTSNPSMTNLTFNNFNDKDTAIEWMFGMMKFNNYIKTRRIANNQSFSKTINGIEYEITINKSKPEKTLEEIKAAAMQKSGSSYPESVLSKQNVGFAGNASKQPRTNHRVIPRVYDEKKWYLQFSPYQYFSHHAILLTDQMEMMNINKNTFTTHMEFVDDFNSLAICSNADLPIVGGSILNHNHYQAGKKEFPIEKVSKKKIGGNHDVDIYLSSWKAATIVLESKDKKQIIDVASNITKLWKEFKTDSKLLVNKENNTVSILTRKVKDVYRTFLVLRNNSTSKERPDGIYHVPRYLQAIKKENIGIIEAIGIAILPGRLQEQLRNLNAQDDELWREWKNWISDKVDINSKTFIEDALAITFDEIIKEVGVFNKDPKIQREFLNKFV